MIKLEDALKDLTKPKVMNKAPFATVVEVSEQGVKIRLDGEEDPREMYYDTLAYVEVGDRVRLDHVSETVIIIAGKLLYYRKG